MLAHTVKLPIHHYIKPVHYLRKCQKNNLISTTTSSFTNFWSSKLFVCWRRSVWPLGAYVTAIFWKAFGFWEIFNYRLSRASRCIECAFGILTNKWRVLHQPLIVTINFADIIKACCILHNFVR